MLVRYKNQQMNVKEVAAAHKKKKKYVQKIDKKELREIEINRIEVSSRISLITF